MATKPRAATQKARQGVEQVEVDLDPGQGTIVPGAAYVAPDTTPPHLTASTSHLGATPAGFPLLPAEAATCGGISLAALEQIASMGRTGQRQSVEALDLMHLHPCVARYRAEVLHYLGAL